MKTVFTHGAVILDACCLINLHASGQMKSILESLNVSLFIAEYVHTEELSSLKSGFDVGEVQVDEQSNLDFLIRAGIIAAVSFESEIEQNLFVNLAVDMDDGEAATAALAVTRNWALGTDDRRAMAYLRQRNMNLPFVSTLEIIKFWADVTPASNDAVKSALTNVRVRGRYKPKSSHPLHSWWGTYVIE